MLPGLFFCAQEAKSIDILALRARFDLRVFDLIALSGRCISSGRLKSHQTRRAAPSQKLPFDRLSVEHCSA